MGEQNQRDEVTTGHGDDSDEHGKVSPTQPPRAWCTGVPTDMPDKWEGGDTSKTSSLVGFVEVLGPAFGDPVPTALERQAWETTFTY